MNRLGERLRVKSQFEIWILRLFPADIYAGLWLDNVLGVSVGRHFAVTVAAVATSQKLFWRLVAWKRLCYRLIKGVAYPGYGVDCVFHIELHGPITIMSLVWRPVCT